MGGCANTQYQWPPGTRGCEPGDAFKTEWDQVRTGESQGGVTGCSYKCDYRDNTQVKCDNRVETTGMPLPQDDPPSVPTPCPVGQPVSVTTGEMFFTHTDAVVGELVFSRTFNTKRLTTARYGAFGEGWNASVEARLRQLGPVLIEARLSDGTPLYYHDDDGDSVYEMSVPARSSSWIQEIPGGYERVFRNGGLETFDSSGQIVSAVDPSGVVTSYSRDTEGRLFSVTRFGRGITIIYEGSSSEPSAIEGPGGLRLATYGYNAQNGWLETVTYPDGSGFRYGYDGAGRVVWVQDLSGTPIEFHEYDGQGRAITSEIADGQEKFTFSYIEDVTNGQTTVTDARGNETVYEWNIDAHVRNVTRVTGPCAGCGAGGGQSQEWTYEGGNITSYTNGLAESWTYEYDPNGSGDRIEDKDPLGQLTTYTHYPDGRVHTRSGPGGSFVEYTYGPAGPLTIDQKVTDTEDRTTTLTYTLEGRLETITDPDGKITKLEYYPSTLDLWTVTDAFGDPFEHTTTFDYDSLGRRDYVKDPLGHETFTTYDTRGRVLRITNHDQTFREFTYDKGGRRTGVTDPLGRTTKYLYDGYGRLEGVVDPLGGLTSYGYDAASNPTSLRDAEGHTTTFGYDAFNRVEKVTYPDGEFEIFVYDPGGRLDYKTDRNGTTTTYVFDELGRLKSKTYDDQTTPQVTFTYHPEGQLWTASNPTDTLTWFYDDAGQLRSEQSTFNNSLVEYEYYPGGNREWVKLNGATVLTYEYDNASRLWKIARGTDLFEFTYDTASRREKLEYPNGVVTHYDYEVDSSRLKKVYSELLGATLTSFEYGYDDAGNRTGKTALDHAEAYEYDRLYRLVQAERTGAGENRWSWVYDAVGNRTTSQIGESHVTTSDFDDANRLTSGDVGGRLSVRGNLNEPGTVTVDGIPARMLAGNVFETTIDAVPGTNVFTVEATDTSGNPSTQQYQVDVSGSTATYQYDPNGNLTQKVVDGVVWGYVWNAENELTAITKGGLGIAGFEYDPLGRRVRKSTLQTNTTYVYDGEDILQSKYSPGTWTETRTFVHGPGIDEPLGYESTGAGDPVQWPPGSPPVPRYYHADGLGSIVAITDAAGAVAQSYQYDAWGNGGPDGYSFTGRERDSQTGLYYYRARYYDPQVGRFISPDPRRPFNQETGRWLPEDPLEANRESNAYAYARDNPVNFVDPEGGLSIPDWAKNLWKKVAPKWQAAKQSYCFYKLQKCITKVEETCARLCPPGERPWSKRAKCMERRDCCNWQYVKCVLPTSIVFRPNWVSCIPS